MKADRVTDWSDAAYIFEQAVLDYHTSRGKRRDEPSVVSTARTNSDLVPKRAANLMDLLARWETGGTIEGKRVLDIGSGFGALSAYLALEGRPAHLTAIDTRTDFVATGSEAVAEMGLSDTVSFVHCDARALHRVGDEPFDLVIANNAFIYLPTREDMDTALAEFFRVLRPGGRVLMYHANRWTLREPFTKAPIVHLLPPRLGTAVGKVTGWKHNHGRVRLIGPGELGRRMRKAGFSDYRFGGFDRTGFAEGKSRYPFYGATALRPE